MRSLALLVGLFVMLVGITGVVAPDSLIAVARYVVTPAGLYAVGALRVAIGLVLILVASISRTPRTLRVVGAIVLVAGLATPLFGAERTQAIFDWELTYGTVLIRAGACLALIIGGFIAFAVAPRRHAV
jgi:hypothetical protein